MNCKVWNLPFGIFLLSLLLPPQSISAQEKSAVEERITRDPAKAVACRAQMNRIHEALTEFQRKYKKLPDWLSELHPEFIDDPKTFVCPHVQSLGDFRVWRDAIRAEVFRDPALNVTYAYEYCAAEYRLGGGMVTTVREYKMRQAGQMGLLATVVPIVRCFAHRPILNLPLRGPIYDSDIEWEGNFAEFVNISDLLTSYLFRDRISAKGPAEKPTERSGSTPSNLLDLSAYFTSALTETWQPTDILEGNDLANLPQGVVQFANIRVRFDVRGIIQLSAKPFLGKFQPAVRNIRVEQKCATMHFLHSTAFNTKTDTEIGRYEVEYSDGQTVKIPVIYGKDVFDWWADPKKPVSPQLHVAWEGVNPATKEQGNIVRLYYSKWGNPRRDQQIKCIHFVSNMGECAPFLLAITLE